MAVHAHIPNSHKTVVGMRSKTRLSYFVRSSLTNKRGKSPMVAREAGVQSKKHAVFLTHLPGMTYACVPAGVWCLRRAEAREIP